jgi:VCBS repeat-containing protein
MLVASGVEFGGEREAALALLPQVIGNVETVIGCVTTRRACGIAVQVAVGDPVRQGDIIETAADGRIAIRFIDGTVLSLSRSARAVLSEFACASDGTSRSALFAVTRGTFAFVSGQLAKTGSLSVDTPFGSIRSRAHAGGIGMLSLAALIFSMMKDAQAADPDITFLDDDSITYKDLAHGAFELVTKEAIPRHIIVEDPGETIVLSRRGSSVSVTPVANSLTRMEELRAAQQDVLANLTKALGPNGSSSPLFDKSLLPLQPINFTQPDAPATQKSLAPLEGTFVSVPDIFFIHPPPPPPIPPTLNLGAGPTEIDTVVFDTFSATSGAFSASSPNSGATLTFGISGGTAGTTVLGGVTYNVSNTGALGTLYLNSTTGAYTFVPNDVAINALKSNTIQSFVITVSDGTLSVSQTFAIPIIGVEDAAIISGTTTGSVIEAGSVANASPGLQTATGTLSDTDPDDPPNTFTAVGSPTKSAGGYGTFTMTAAGVWTYTLDEANSAVQALKVGDTLIDTFTVTAIDGTPQVVTITIHGPLIGATGAAPSLTLSETHLTATALDDNIAGSAPNAALTTTSGNFSTAFTSVQGADGATISYALSITGGNGTVSGLIDSHTGLADVLVLNGNTIEGHVGATSGTLAFTITLDPTTGLVTFTEYRPVTQPFGTSPDGGEGVSLTAGIVNLTATVTDKNGNFQAVGVDLGSRLTITDDGPSVTATGTAPSLTLSETHLTATSLDGNVAGSAPNAALMTTSGNFSTAFTSIQGADGATISYALSITGGNGTASGLIDSHTGLADVLVLNGNTIEGHVGTTSGTLAFTITLDPTTGLVTFTEYRAVTQPFGTNPDGGEGVSLTAGIVNLTATVADKDGDFQNASLDLGSRLTITDDGPSITAVGTGPSLTLSETHLTATALDGNVAGSAPNAALTTTSGNFSTVFTSVQGADGATISYALSITGGNGTASGLIDSHTGQADVLVLNGNTIEGHVGTTGGTLAFTIALDPTTGLVIFTEYRAVTQPFGTNPDGGEGVSLTAGIVNLTATITDKDGDFQTASLDLGKQLTITDDGPTIGGFESAFLAAQDNQIANGTYNVNFGADGDAAMLVAVHNGAVGSTGYNLATSSLGGGITSVHVTGNGDDYTFYYSTHAVSGGVELDAYLTDTNGTLTNPYFTLLIKPDGTYSFDLESVGLLKQVTVTGASFGASGGGTPSLTAPDGLLVITGSDNSGHPLDVKASNNGFAVGDTGLQMDPNEDLHLTFLQEQSKISFNFTQWQGNGTADVIFKVLDGATDIHDFNINIPKPSGGITNIVVQETSNAALIDTFAFDSTTSTYTLYVGQTFNQVQVDYDQAVTGNATFAVNNITYDEKSTIPSTDLLFDVSAVDSDGDSAATSLQVNLQGSTTGATGLALTGTSGSALALTGTLGSALTLTGTSGTDVLSGSSGDPAAVTSSTMTSSVIVAATDTPGTPISTSTPTDTNVNNPSNAFTTVSWPTKGDRGYGSFTMTAAGVWAYTPDNSSAVNTLNIGDRLTDIIIGGFGAVLLTGGNGNAAGNSSAAGFVSGTDKIDLTALGGLDSAILALTPTSTSVPAHTIAWRFDSKTNEVIVYVNPTDQTLSIGNSGLAEIHLQGVSTVHASDFILASTTATVVAASDSINPAAMTPSDATVFAAATDASIATTTTADGSSDTSVSSSALLAAWDCTAQTTRVGYGFDAARDQADSIHYARFASFDGVGTHPIESTVDDAVIAPPSGLSIELPHAAVTALMQTSFAFDQKPMFDSADLMTIGHGAATHGLALEGNDWFLPSDSHWKGDSEASLKHEDHGASIPGNGGPTDAGDTHGHRIDTDSDVVPNQEVLKTPKNDGGNRSISSEAGEHGTPPGHGGDVHGGEPASIAHVLFGGTAATHGLGESFHFSDEISGPGNPGGSDLAELHHIPASIGHHDDAAGPHGPPATPEGGEIASARGLGDSFHFSEKISGPGDSGVIDLAKPDHIPASIGHHDDVAGTHGPLAVSEAAQTIELSLPGQDPADHFDIVPDHARSALITHGLHDLIV